MISTIFLVGVAAALSVLDDAALDAALLARPHDRVHLRAAGDRTEVLLNGTPIVPKIYKTTGSSSTRIRDLNREIPATFTRCGFNLFTFAVDLAQAADDGAPERIRLELREWLRREPDLHVILEFSVKPWEGWGESHPSEVFRTDRGRYVLMSGCRPTELADAPRTYRGTDPKDRNLRFPAISYASEFFAQAAAEKIARIVAYLEDKPEGRAVVGAFLGGGCDGQWFDLHDMRLKSPQDKAEAHGLAADYSDAARNGFRAYLQRMYKTPEALAAAWGRTTPVPFASVEVPSTAALWVPRARYREFGRSPEADYNRFMAWATAHFTDTLAQAVKKASGGRLFAGGYYKGAGLGGYPNIALAGTRYRFRPGDGYDFIATVPSYRREWNDPVVTTVYNGSMVDSSKLYVGELDLRNPEIKNWGLWGQDAWRTNHNAATFRTEAIKFALAAVTAGGGYHAYDMNGGWYRTPAAQETWRVVNALADRARPLPPSKARLAVVGGEDYFDYQSLGEQPGRLFAYGLKRDLQRMLGFSGVPFANYLVDEILAHPSVDLPSLVVFSDLTGVSLEAFQELRRRYANGSRVLVYLGRPGTFTLGAEAIAREFASFAPVPDIPGTSVRRGTDVLEYRFDDPKALTTTLVRRLAREAGFAPIVETDEILYFGSGLLVLQAQSDGVKRLTLPTAFEPGETLYGPAFRQDGSGVSVALKRTEVFVMTYREKMKTTPGVTFRFDDAHPAADWRELAAVFEARGLKATFAVNPGLLKTDDQRRFLVEAASKGHEIIDHTPNHAIFSYLCRDQAEFDALAGARVVQETVPSERRLNLCYEPILDHPLNFHFRGAVSNGFLLVSRETAARLHRPDKVFLPSLGRAFGFYDAPDGRLRLRTFWTTSLATLEDQPEGDLVCVSRRAFRMSPDVLRFQAARARETFRRLGLPDPKAWAQPGGWEPWLDDRDFKRVYADEFGYVLGDAFVPCGEKPDPSLAAFHNRYRSYFDNKAVTHDSIRRDIRAAVAKGETLSFISHMKPPEGMSWPAWLQETDELLAWLVAAKIPVLTASGLASCWTGVRGGWYNRTR